jgi:hypothetical protein
VPTGSFLWRRLATALLPAIFGLAACSESDTPTQPRAGEAVFVVRACVGSETSPAGESFRILLRDPVKIAEAAALVGRGGRKIVAGRLRAGNGGFNPGWSWHLEPESVELVDAAVEVCDGCPHDVQADPGYWIDNLGRYCPWSSEIIAREQ